MSRRVAEADWGGHSAVVATGVDGNGPAKRPKLPAEGRVSQVWARPRSTLHGAQRGSLWLYYVGADTLTRGGVYWIVVASL